MKYLFSLLILFPLISCNKDKPNYPAEDQQPQPYVIQDCITVGDSVSNNITFTNISPDISLSSFNVTVYYELDIDGDGTSDFQFSVHSAYPFAGQWFNGSSVKVNSLTPTAEILKDSLYADSSYSFPHLYLENDLLKQDSYWGTGETYISTNGDDSSDGCFGPGCPHASSGVFFGQSNAYIGIRLGSRLGWIKISLTQTDPNGGQTLIIHEYGIVD